MKGFDPDKFPKDHIWKDYFNFSEKTTCYYNIIYNVFCENCYMIIGHSEPKAPAGFRKNMFVVYELHRSEIYYTSCAIDYTKIYSCSEMLIKNIIE